jgi:hypothetical protein
MPLQKVHWTGSSWKIFQGAGREEPDDFVPGVTMPRYQITPNFTGSKNVGNLPGVTLTLYNGTQGSGTLVLSTAGATYTNIDFGNRILDIRANCTFNNCRSVLTDVAGTTIPEQIRILNGTATLVTFNDCEFHNRAQYIMNGVMGRNFVFNRCVFTGQVDCVNNSSSGTAPQTSGGVVNDSWLGDQAWWRWSSTGVVHPSDTQTHNDGSQSSIPNMKWTNCFFGCWPSEYVGTGTPNSGSETNPHTATYITTQATMDSWRSTYLNQWTRPDQSFDGIARRTSTGGSWAPIMGTLSGGGALNHEVMHCYFSGGTVQINYSNANLSGNAGFIKQSTFWNDMSAGHSLPTSTVKGTAVYVKSGLTLDMPTTGSDVNRWFDDTVVSPDFV